MGAGLMCELLTKCCVYSDVACPTKRFLFRFRRRLFTGYEADLRTSSVMIHNTEEKDLLVQELIRENPLVKKIADSFCLHLQPKCIFYEDTDVQKQAELTENGPEVFLTTSKRILEMSHAAQKGRQTLFHK